MKKYTFFSIKLPMLAMLFGLFLFSIYFVSPMFALFFASSAIAAFMAAPFLGSIQGILMWIAYLAYLGSEMLSYYTGINPFIAGILGLLLLTSVTVNDKTRAILPHLVRRIVAAILILATIFYLFHIKAWTIGNFILLMLPAVLFKFVNIYDIMDEGHDWHDNYNTFSG